MSNLDHILSRVKKLPEAHVAEEIYRKAYTRFNLNIKEISVLKEFLTPITPPFFNGVINCDPLKAMENKGYNDFLTPITPITPKNDSTGIINSALEDFEERAAIIEYDACIPCDWAETIAKTQLRPKPKAITVNKWVKIQIALGMLLPHLKNIIAFEWKTSDIFGCHAIAPEARFNVMGLLMLLNEGDTIVEITKDVIRIQNSRGKVLSYSRPFYHCRLEQAYLHEIA